jgi:hypothetical protein
MSLPPRSRGELVKESIPGESLGAADSFLMPGRGSEQLRSRRRATPILFGRLVQPRNTYDQLIHSLGGGDGRPLPQCSSSHFGPTTLPVPHGRPRTRMGDLLSRAFCSGDVLFCFWLGVQCGELALRIPSWAAPLAQTCRSANSYPVEPDGSVPRCPIRGADRGLGGGTNLDGGILQP